MRTSVVAPAHFKTDMFAGFESAIPEWLAPSLEVGTVAGLVERTVLSGESQVRRRFGPFARRPKVNRTQQPAAVCDHADAHLHRLRRSQHLIEPFYAKCTPLGRALPTWLYGAIL